MVLVRRRYYYWLLKAYFKRWGKVIFAAVLGSAVAFTLLFLLLSYFLLPSLSDEVERIGLTGSYTTTNLPPEVMDNVSYGLTKVSADYEVQPGAAASWKITDSGKKYTFTLKKGQKFTDGKEFTAHDVPLNFRDVTKKVIDDYTIEYTLKDPFAPFLSVVSRPILVGKAGLGEYKIGKVSQEAGFVKEITLMHMDTNRRKIFYFYPTQEALKTAFELGEIDQAIGLSQFVKPDESFKGWKHIEVEKGTDYGKLVSLFFNTQEDQLSNKKLRQALLYSLPEAFSEGERTYSFLPQQSIYYSRSPNEGLRDLELSKSLLDASSGAKLTLEVSTAKELVPVAQKVINAWKEIGVEGKIREVAGIPQNYQVLLYTMNLPKDPDMYTLWHSGQSENLTGYANVRIDKLLEDGRQTVDTTERQAIYADMQKYLIDDSPSAFLYFPYKYTLIRK